MTSDQSTTVRAADLAERIVEEVSEAGQDWHAIELRAQELVEVLARLAAGGSAPAHGVTGPSGPQV